MSTNAMEIRQPVEPAQWKSPGAVKQRVQAIQQLMQEVLKPGSKENEFSGDYGIIPGTGKKPSLWKSGSEQILAMFEIAVEPIVEDLSTDDCYRYRVTTRLTHAPTGNFLGAGIGEASSDETKYKWRRTYSQKEFDSTDFNRRRTKFSQYKDGNGMWADKEELQVRTEPADVANTILKMAKKRSQIDATLTVTGASSMFDQDLEDIPDDQKRSMEEQRGSRGKARATASVGVKCSECNATGGHLPKCSKKNPAAQAPAKADAVMCSDCGKINGHDPTCKHAAKSETTKPGLQKALVLILRVEKRMKKANKDGVQEPFVKLSVVNQANEEFDMMVWHKTPQEFLTTAVIDKNMLCDFSTAKKTDGTEYRSLETIYELAGVPFVDNKPAQQAEAPEDF